MSGVTISYSVIREDPPGKDAFEHRPEGSKGVRRQIRTGCSRHSSAVLEVTNNQLSEMRFYLQQWLISIV